MNEFLELMFQIVRKWSDDRKSREVLVYKEPSIETLLEAKNFKKIKIHNIIFIISAILLKRNTHYSRCYNSKTLLKTGQHRI